MVITPLLMSKNVGASWLSRTGIVILISLLLAESLMVTYVHTNIITIFIIAYTIYGMDI